MRAVEMHQTELATNKSHEDSGPELLNLFHELSTFSEAETALLRDSQALVKS